MSAENDQVGSVTLTSLAMLKVHMDHNEDYLDYLKPFIIHILNEDKANPVSSVTINEKLRTHFGLVIPERTIQIVLKRFTRHGFIKRESGLFIPTDKLPETSILQKRAEAARHISSVVSGLIEFSKSYETSFQGEEEATLALFEFLDNFHVSCLKAYVQGTALPHIKKKNAHKSTVFIVSEYVIHINNHIPERFESFMVMVKGHMLANALLCPDLNLIPKTFKKVTFFLDTRLLIRLLALENEHKFNATRELVVLLKNLGGKLAIFTHTKEELLNVLNNSIEHFDDLDAIGSIINEARRTNRSKSDLIMVQKKLDDFLDENRIFEQKSPPYNERYQIDERAFEVILEKELSYFSNKAKLNDINSIRSIFALREGTAPRSIEDATAILVTSNTGVATAAYRYGESFEVAKAVSTVITDFSLANIAWLKAPMGASMLPTTEVLALAYAALEPTKQLLAKYIHEINKLEEKGTISARDHQLLRSSLAQDNLMTLTHGDETALNETTIFETIKRTTDEIKKEATIELDAATRALRDEKLMNKSLIDGVFWKCEKKARRSSSAIAVFTIVVLLLAELGVYRITDSNLILSVIFGIILAFAFTFSFLGTVFGLTVTSLYDRTFLWLRNRYIKDEMKSLRLDYRDFFPEI